MKTVSASDRASSSSHSRANASSNAEAERTSPRSAVMRTLGAFRIPAIDARDPTAVGEAMRIHVVHAVRVPATTGTAQDRAAIAQRALRIRGARQRLNFDRPYLAAVDRIAVLREAHR